MRSRDLFRFGVLEPDKMATSPVCSLGRLQACLSCTPRCGCVASMPHTCSPFNLNIYSTVQAESGGMGLRERERTTSPIRRGGNIPTLAYLNNLNILSESKRFKLAARSTKKEMGTQRWAGSPHAICIFILSHSLDCVLSPGPHFRYSLGFPAENILWIQWDSVFSVELRSTADSDRNQF